MTAVRREVSVTVVTEGKVTTNMSFLTYDVRRTLHSAARYVDDVTGDVTITIVDAD